MSTVKIAQFTTPDQFKLVCYFAFNPGSGYIQTSEWVEVEFKPIAEIAVIEQQVRDLEKVRESALAQYNAAIAAVRTRKAELEALTQTAGVTA